MTRKIKFVIVTLFFTGLLFLFSSNRAYADEVVTQIVSDPAPSTDTATVTSTVTIQSIETKLNEAQANLSSAAQTQGDAIISTIQANVPIVDTQTAVSIAKTQEPIKTAVESATVVIQEANSAIQSAQTAITVVLGAQANVETQTATVAVTQTIVDSATVTANNAQTILTTETEKLPDLQSTVDSNAGVFYTENANLGTATSNLQTAQTNLTNAQTDLANSQPTTVVTNGVKATTYAYSGSTGSPLPTESTTPLSTTTVASTNFEWGSGQVLNSGRVDNVIVKFEGTITLPDEATLVRYNTYADDGTKLYIDGQLAINNWRDQGPSYSQYSQTYNVSTDKQQDFVLWYYEHGGGASVHLGWMIIRADGTGYFTFPQASAFSSVVTTPDPVKVAAVNTAQNNLTSAQSSYSTQLAVRDEAYQAWQDAIHAVDSQQSTIDSAQAAYDAAQQNLTSAQQNLTAEQQNLTTASQNLTIALQTADSLANTAATKVNEAVSAMTNAAQVTTNYYAEQQRIAAENARIAAEQAAAQAAQEKAAAEERARIAAENAAKAEAARIAAEQAIADAKIAQEKAAAEAKAAEDARIIAEQAAKDAQAAADKAKADAEIQAAKDAQAKADAEKAAADAAKAEADAKAKAEQDAALAEQKAKDEAAKATQEAANAKAEADKQKAEADKIAADQAAKEQQAKDAKAKADAQKAADDKAKQDAIGVKPNSPDQLSDTVAKEAPKEILVPHIQQDIKGVENGGIEFFGTKSAPQVVGEDGKLTPAAPPPGSGLPIPADAITTADTFIGQPGGTSFNSPDVAVPVILTPVTGALASVPGVQAVNQAFVAMANIGNDMSPVTRKKAKKILVLTIAVAAIRRRFN
ncbi:PA14 domain containing protein [uncultured Caudovirales phage]|uniref:PA14 domain containing protein n=1 Tax=uncultured Caudovirales phage TaxID=2100421 RepID=A0A6J7WJ61_9CAUD|nr:PA14 domain containing protein [uncultured Caudovirales phage]